MELDLPTDNSPPKVVDVWKILLLTHSQVPANYYMYTLMHVLTYVIISMVMLILSHSDCQG